VLSLGASAVITVGPTGILPAAAAAGGTQPGTVSCKQLSGGIRFNPPLKTDGTSPEVTNVNVTARDCKAHDGGATPHTGKGTEAFSGTNDCATLESGDDTPASFSVEWSSGDGESTIAFAGFSTLTTGKAGFSVGGIGTEVSGSYPGADGGASSTATVISNLTSAQIASACNGSSGLRSLKIRSGSLDIG